MRNAFITLGIMGAALAVQPALAAHRGDRGAPPRDDSNSYWLDYKTDVSEAKRELRDDLRHAGSAQDKREAWAEYRREIADAEKDYAKQMLDKGYRLGTVHVEEVEEPGD